MKQINNHGSYKIGLNEVQDLKETMLEIMKPIQAALKSKIYYSEVDLDEAAYKSCDGFIPYSHNCGGIEISEVIPKCEEYDFSYLEFGDCEHTSDDDCGYDDDGSSECVNECEGHLDAALKIFFKFEGLDKNGTGSFYIILHGGNSDAPYFRSSTDIYEAEFDASTMDELKRNSQKAISDLIRIIKK